MHGACSHQNLQVYRFKFYKFISLCAHVLLLRTEEMLKMAEVNNNRKIPPAFPDWRFEFGSLVNMVSSGAGEDE